MKLQGECGQSTVNAHQGLHRTCAPSQLVTPEFCCSCQFEKQHQEFREFGLESLIACQGTLPANTRAHHTWQLHNLQCHLPRCLRPETLRCGPLPNIWHQVLTYLCNADQLFMQLLKLRSQEHLLTSLRRRRLVKDLVNGILHSA